MFYPSRLLLFGLSPFGGIPLPGSGIVGKNWSAQSKPTVRSKGGFPLWSGGGPFTVSHSDICPYIPNAPKPTQQSLKFSNLNKFYKYSGGSTTEHIRNPSVLMFWFGLEWFGFQMVSSIVYSYGIDHLKTETFQNGHFNLGRLLFFLSI